MSTRDTFDGPWKEVLDQYIDPFLAFFLPDLHAAINWERGIEMLDKEFQQLLPPEETEEGERRVDKLIKAWRGADPFFILIHTDNHEPSAYVWPIRVNVCLAERPGTSVSLTLHHHGPTRHCLSRCRGHNATARPVATCTATCGTAAGGSLYSGWGVDGSQPAAQPDALPG